MQLLPEDIQALYGGEQSYFLMVPHQKYSKYPKWGVKNRNIYLKNYIFISYFISIKSEKLYLISIKNNKI